MRGSRRELAPNVSMCVFSCLLNHHGAFMFRQCCVVALRREFNISLFAYCFHPLFVHPPFSVLQSAWGSPGLLGFLGLGFLACWSWSLAPLVSSGSSAWGSSPVGPGRSPPWSLRVPRLGVPRLLFLVAGPPGLLGFLGLGFLACWFWLLACWSWLLAPWLALAEPERSVRRGCFE